MFAGRPIPRDSRDEDNFFNNFFNNLGSCRYDHPGELSRPISR